MWDVGNTTFKIWVFMNTKCCNREKTSVTPPDGNVLAMLACMLLLILYSTLRLASMPYIMGALLPHPTETK